MKYEEWIKYEERRKRLAAQQTWITLPAEPTPRLAKRTRRTPPLLKRRWTLVVQLFNSPPA